MSNNWTLLLLLLQQLFLLYDDLTLEVLQKEDENLSL